MVVVAERYDHLVEMNYTSSSCKYYSFKVKFKRMQFLEKMRSKHCCTPHEEINGNIISKQFFKSKIEIVFIYL